MTLTVVTVTDVIGYTAVIKVLYYVASISSCPYINIQNRAYEIDTRKRNELKLFGI